MAEDALTISVGVPKTVLPARSPAARMAGQSQPTVIHRYKFFLRRNV